MKACPVCHLSSSDSAQVCDCGFHFEAGHKSRTPSSALAARTVKSAWRYGMVFAGVYLVLVILLFADTAWQISGAGERNASAWLLFVLSVPILSVLVLVGVQSPMRDAVLLMAVLANVAIAFGAGALYGKWRRRGSA